MLNKIDKGYFLKQVFYNLSLNYIFKTLRLLMNKISVPFCKVDKPNETVRASIEQVLASGIYFRGAFTKHFSADFSAYIGMPYLVPTANCTDAIEIVLRGLNLRTDDEVITPAFSWYSDASMISWVGAKPVFADIDATTFMLTLASIKQVVTLNTKVLLLPHLFGMVCPEVREIADFCREKRIVLIEDCAQAHGATLNGNKAGSFAEIAVFSFYPTKNLGALGDAGCILTKNKQLRDSFSLIANHGQLKKDEHILLGKNSRMDELQAAVLAAKLPELDFENKKRVALAEIYFEQLKDLPIHLPIRFQGNVYHQFVVKTLTRNALIDFLANGGIETAIHYPHALSDIEVFGSTTGTCQKATEAASQVLSLPIFPNHSADEVLYVCEQIRGFYSAF